MAQCRIQQGQVRARRRWGSRAVAIAATLVTLAIGTGPSLAAI
jgi:hypothetical protein